MVFWVVVPCSVVSEDRAASIFTTTLHGTTTQKTTNSIFINLATSVLFMSTDIIARCQGDKIPENPIPCQTGQWDIPPEIPTNTCQRSQGNRPLDTPSNWCQTDEVDIPPEIPSNWCQTDERDRPPETHSNSCEINRNPASPSTLRQRGQGREHQWILLSTCQVISPVPKIFSAEKKTKQWACIVSHEQNINKRKETSRNRNFLSKETKNHTFRVER